VAPARPGPPWTAGPRRADERVGLGGSVEASCEGGICGACRVHWLEGPPLHRDRVLSPAEREHDLMACVAGCTGPRLVLDL